MARTPRPATRATRRDIAIEEHLDTIAELLHEAEKLSRKIKERYVQKLEQIPSDIDKINNYLFDEGFADSESLKRNLRNDLMGFLRELTAKYPMIPTLDEVMFDLIQMEGRLYDLLVWLEVDTERVRHRTKEIADAMKITYDTSDPFWVQKVHSARDEIWKAKAKNRQPQRR